MATNPDTASVEELSEDFSEDLSEDAFEDGEVIPLSAEQQELVQADLDTIADTMKKILDHP